MFDEEPENVHGECASEIHQLQAKLEKAEAENWRLRELAGTEVAKIFNKLQEAIEFILWVSPCGQVEQNPPYKLIGDIARNLLERLRE